jgi:hypothetical protein
LLRFLLTTTLSFFLWISAAHAAQTTFFKNLAGTWSGSGRAYVSKYGDITVSCRIVIAGAESQLAMNGSCGMLVFRQRLGFSIKRRAGNEYTGTYSGPKTGTAMIQGTLKGDRLIVNIRWAGLVNGDRTAQMVLARTGPNSFSQTVTDKVGGKNRRTSVLEFRRM